MIGVLDYGMGNLFSIEKIIRNAGCSVKVVANEQEILRSDKIIFPGVGHFGKAIFRIRELNLMDSLNEFAHIKKKPIMGICLGMQLMASFSEEGDVPGLGWIPGTVSKFQPKNKTLYKVPHTGWNTLTYRNPACESLDGIDASDEFYFVHSYYFHAAEDSHILCKTQYDIEFVSGIQRDNIIGYQFHPEKSHDAGAKLIHNFLKL
jgi:glutamine amidotransferase